MERGRIQGLPKFLGYPLLSQERVKLRTSNFVGTFIGWVGTKAHENVGNSGRWHRPSQGVPKIFRAPICRAHCAVIFAIAQLSRLFYFLSWPVILSCCMIIYFFIFYFFIQAMMTCVFRRPVKCYCNQNGCFVVCISIIVC